MQPEKSTTSEPRQRWSGRIFAAAALLAVLAFFAGWMPKHFEQRRVNAALQTAELDLRLSDLHRRLGVASHEAQRDNFPAAGIAAMEFFEGARAVVETHPFTNEPRTRTALAAYAGYGDEILRQIAMNDPAVKERLASLYLAMDGVLQRRD